MKSLIYFSAILSLVTAAAIPEPVPEDLKHLDIRQSSSTENDLKNGNGCKQVLVIFARGTTEAGNVGSIAGPPFFGALKTSVGAGNVAVQGVDYPADVAGFLAGGDRAGSATMASLVNQAISQCPSTAVVMSGYSQGGQLVHNAAKQLSAANSAKVSSVVIFGDPDDGQAVGSIPSSKVKVICHAGDNICDGGALVLPAHLTYGQDAGTAAAFAKSKL